MTETADRVPHTTQPLVLAVWAGLVFGLAEGVALVLIRGFPTLRAPYKVSEDILWAGPLLHIATYIVVAAAVWGIAGILHRSGAARLRWVAAALVLAGTTTVLNAPGVLHPLSVPVLAVGLTLAAMRRYAERLTALSVTLRRRLLLVPAVLLATAAGTASWQRLHEVFAVRALPPASPDAPNVLFIIIDTLRRDRIEGSDSTLAPTLQGLARSGARYTNAWAASSWSLPSHMTLLTGQYPAVHGADWPRLRPSSGVFTIPEVFAAHGYVTAAFSGNANWVTPEYVGGGFHRFDVYTLEQLLLRTTFGGAISRLMLKPLGIHPSGRGRNADRLDRELQHFVEEYRGRPYFAYVTYMDVNQSFHRERHGHAFWQAPASMAEVINAYDAGVQRLDGQLGRTLDELRSRGHLENTIVVVTSDHGESFGAAAGDHDPIGHGTSLYPEQTRVPLLLVYPPRVPAGTVISAAVSLRSVAGSIARLSGLDTQAFSSPLPFAETSDTTDVLMSLRYGDRHADAVVRGSEQAITTRSGGESMTEILKLDAEAASIVRSMDPR